MSTLAASRHALDPIDRMSEVLFGLIMVLTFTGTLSVAGAGRAEVRQMLLEALGCNTAWGLIDAVFYLMGVLAEKGRNLRTIHAVRQAADAAAAQELIAGALPPVVAAALKPAEYAALHEQLNRLPEPPVIARLDKEDWLGAAWVFLLVFLSTLPVVIPFMFMHEIAPAMRVSNLIAIVMLAFAGAKFGRVTGRSPWAMGLGMVVFGTLLVALTIRLGG